MTAHHGPQSWLIQIPGLPTDEKLIHVNGAILIFAAILVISIFARLAINKGIEKLVVPDPKPTVGGIIDVLVEGLYNTVVSILGHHGEQYFAMIASLFLFVLLSNLMGLLPLSSPPTSNLSTTFALGLASFIFYNIHGIKAHGIVGYLKHFLMGMGLFGLPIAFFELISHALRPVTLGLRLGLNMKIDHLLAHTFGELVAYILPVPLLLFGIVVCTIQAFLFAVLTSVYVQMATEHEEEHH